jgi:hypothetical protein
MGGLPLAVVSCGRRQGSGKSELNRAVRGAESAYTWQGFIATAFENALPIGESAMRIVMGAVGLCLAVVVGCAQVPKESVELSTTVGRDLAVTHKAHIQLARVLFERMKEDVNRFIDGTYAPFQIRAAMARQVALANSSDVAEKRKSLLLAIHAAFEPDASDRLQSAVLQGMESLVTQIRADIEAKRRELLEPLEEQERVVMGGINRAYQRMHYANSIVTGHLGSIARVHDAQSELLEEIGIDRDLRKDIGEGLAGVSAKISTLVNRAEKVDDKIAGADTTAKNLLTEITELGKALADENEEP